MGDNDNCHFTVAWQTQFKQRSDQSMFMINPGSVSYEGMLSGTTYYLYMMGIPTDSTLSVYDVHLASGDPPVPPPTTPSDTYAIIQNYDRNMPLGIVTVTTPATSGSSGSSGGNAICPDGTRCYVFEETRGVIKVVDVLVGDSLRGEDVTTGETVYRKVIGKMVEHSSTWRMVNGCPLSPTDEIWDGKNWIHPYKKGDLDTTPGKRVHLRLEASNHHERNYHLVNEGGETLVITHNSTVTC